MKITPFIGGLALALSIISCSSSNGVDNKLANYATLFADDAFPTYKMYNIESEQEVFELDGEMKTFAEKKLRGISDSKRRIDKLVEYLFSREHIDLSYQSDANLTASQAFHSQTANCLSLTIMAYSLAKYADLEANFRNVDVPEYWMRNGSYNTLTGHVNLEVRPKKPHNTPVVIFQRATRIDFDPSIASQNFNSSEISKSTILSMFYNNKGGDALVSGRYDLAYAYFRKAATTQPKFSSTWSNLGVLYRVKQLLEKAQNSYQFALYVDESNYTAQRNLALTLALLGEHKQANEIIARIHRKRLKNPYYFVMLGDEAYFKSNYRDAVSFYRHALKLGPKIHEVYFGLTKAYYALNDVEKAEKSIQMAIKHSHLTSVSQEYVAKLNWIREQR